MTEISPELKALADAALACSGYEPSLSVMLQAADAYRATQAKECRPPDGAKNCTYFHLTDRDGEHFIALWQNGKWDFTGDDKSYAPNDPSLRGWTVHSECRFGETGGEATEVAELRAQKDGAYLERNQVVVGLASLAMALGYRAGRAKTAIEGWSEDWHGCVYIDLPTGQVSWHYHDSQAGLFEWLPSYGGAWDGHDTPEKYRRVIALSEDDPPNLTHFRAPKLEISDEELLALGREVVRPWTSDRWEFHHDAALAFARAVIAKVSAPTDGDAS